MKSGDGDIETTRASRLVCLPSLSLPHGADMAAKLSRQSSGRYHDRAQVLGAVESLDWPGYRNRPGNDVIEAEHGRRDAGYGGIAFAASLDTFSTEPPQELLFSGSMSAIMTPHIGGVTSDAYRNMGTAAAKNILSVLAKTSEEIR